MLRRFSPISGKFEYYLPLKKKILFYAISIASCSFVIVLTLIWMVLSLNARGFTDPDHKLIYFEDISALAAPGGLFDANTFAAQIPNLIHVLITNVFDEAFYRPLAKKMTRFEKHLNPKSF